MVQEEEMILTEDDCDAREAAKFSECRQSVDEQETSEGWELRTAGH